MEPRPFTLRLFVPSGRPEEIRILEKICWSGIGLSVPRSHLTEFNQREEASRPGVYVLHGRNLEGVQDIIYIGEADPLGRRLSQHQKKDFWTTAYVFTVQNDHLNKAHFQYLEEQLLCRARDAKRCHLENKQTGNSITLSESDKASAETFLEELLLCCPVFGLRAFEKPNLRLTDESMKEKDSNTRVSQERSKQPSMHLSREPDSSKILCLTGKGASGKGYESPKGFTVLKGAKGRKEPVESFQEGYYRLRQELLEQGVFDDAEDAIHLRQDYEFSAPSTAASILLGRTANGLSEWKDTMGRTLQKIRETMADAVSEEESPLKESPMISTSQYSQTERQSSLDQSEDQQERHHEK